MKVEVESISDIEKRLKVAVSSDEIDKKIDKAYQDLKKSVKLKGFRPGKAPVAILKRHFKSQVEEDVISEIVKETYPAALDELSLSPISQPKVENSVLEQGKEFSYTAVFEIKPQIDIREYEGLALEKDVAGEVTDKDVDGEIEKIRNNFATMKDVTDRPSQKGDYLVADIEGTVDEKAYDGSTQNGYFLEIGSDSFLPGFDEHLTGLKKGETKEFTLDIPQGNANKQICGKTVKFNLLIKEVKEKILPPVDDEFAKDLGDYTDLNALRVKIKESLAERRLQDGEASLKEKIFDSLIEKNPFDVPKSMIETQIRNMIMNTQQMLSNQGMKLEDLGQSPEQMQEQYRQPAERQVRSALLLDAVAQKEGLKVEPANLEEKYMEIAKQANQGIEMVKAKITPEMLEPQIVEKKAIEFIISKADITEKTIVK
jgi:trigger factor